ncbi:hypothetical protein Dimus_014609 [Dionaea muscipula]
MVGFTLPLFFCPQQTRDKETTGLFNPIRPPYPPNKQDLREGEKKKISMLASRTATTRKNTTRQAQTVHKNICNLDAWNDYVIYKVNQETLPQAQTKQTKSKTTKI